MGKQYEAIDGKLQAWIERQKMFFVATAPLSGNGFVNCSLFAPSGKRSRITFATRPRSS